jgi:LPXTG-motif cell wall-anchored protein
MNRDTLKTILGLIVIVLIVVATFLYGNAQRQAQLKRDQEVKQQQTAQTSTSPAASASTSAGTSNTAPVSSPTANNIQGGQPSQPPTGGSTSSTSVNSSGIPDTGSSSVAAAGLLALASAFAYWRRSRRAVMVAVRSKS